MPIHTHSCIPRNFLRSVEGSTIEHVHRWTNAKRFNKLENGSKLIILRCRRCEVMKSIEIYVEFDKKGRAIAKRSDRLVEDMERVHAEANVQVTGLDEDEGEGRGSLAPVVKQDESPLK